jgi:hypothetical protein
VCFHRFAHAPDAPQENAAKPENFSAHARGHLRVYLGIGRGKRAIARGERALDVAELAQELAHERFGFDLLLNEVRRVCDVCGASRDGKPALEMAFVVVEARRANHGQTGGAGRCDGARGAAQTIEVLHAFAATAEHAIDRFERLVHSEHLRIVVREQPERAPVIPNRELSLIAGARGVSRLDVELRRARAIFAACEVTRHDRRRKAACQVGGREEVAERAVHSDACLRLERDVCDVARERVSEVDDVTFAIDEPARAQASDRVHHAVRGQFFEDGDLEWTARDREPVHDVLLLLRQLLDAIREELLERRWKARLASLGSDEDVCRLALSGDLAYLEGSALEQRIDHLEQEERVSADPRQ